MIGSIIAADFAFSRGSRPLQSAGRFHATPLAGERGAQAGWPQATASHPGEVREAGTFLERWLA